MQDVVERIWDFIDDFNLNSILKFLKDNIVGTVVVISLLFWIPISCLISYIDRKRAEKVKLPEINGFIIFCLYPIPGSSMCRLKNYLLVKNIVKRLICIRKCPVVQQRK
jgi:hypothetical protein